MYIFHYFGSNYEFASVWDVDYPPMVKGYGFAIAGLKICYSFLVDGSEAKYYLSTSAGSKHWVIHLQGGGGCISFKDCQRRTKGPLGSSIGLDQKVTGEWTLSNDPAINPTFYKWNKVLVPYCRLVYYFSEFGY